jgi:hypothetical protein
VVFDCRIADRYSASTKTLDLTDGNFVAQQLYRLMTDDECFTVVGLGFSTAEETRHSSYRFSR